MVNVIGLGYIGLPTALMLAANGSDVVGTDINTGLVLSLTRGRLTFSEAGLPELFHEARQNIRFTSEYQNSAVYIITVPTPYDSCSKKINMAYVISAFKQIQEVCPADAVIVIESTVSPGSIDRHIRPLITKKVHIAHAPERIIPGNMIHELKTNSRTIGVDDDATGQTLKALYGSFCQGEIVLTDIRTAEMSKVIENTYRDINIAFANELAQICHSDGLDVYEIIRIANKHPRVNIMHPGPGVGGHCISVDPWFLVGDYPGLANIVLAARKINDSMPEFVLRRIFEVMRAEGITDCSRVGLYGLTYKENVDDTRESPTLQLLDRMKKHLAKPLRCYDPYEKNSITENQVFSLQEFLSGLDLIVIMVAHDEIRDHADMLQNRTVLDVSVRGGIKAAYRLC
jgi:UDP-N-acetyl-D-mannosaminuronic acid dehydrogenase